MFKKVIMALFLLSLMGCAGLGFNKQATLMPDTVGLYYETAQFGEKKDWNPLKIGVRSDWKFSAPPLKEKK